MPDKKGSSSYDAGDCGGSHGDYTAEHGVSTNWTAERTRAGMDALNKTAKGRKRITEFSSKMGAKADDSRTGLNRRAAYKTVNR